MKSIGTIALIVGLLASTLVQADTPQHWKQSGRVHSEPQLLFAQQSRFVDGDTAAALVRSATGGRVLGIRSSTSSGRNVYQVKVLVEGGHVRIVRVDAQTGQLLD
ncbi:MAG: PepSY domain-containing protein [Gammaproteobacteria bacterium]